MAEKINTTQDISVALRAPSLPRGETPSNGDPHRAAPAAASDPEVPAKAARRRFTAEDKLRILKLADACTERGSLGALLRQEGLYSSNFAAWRRQRDAGTLSALTPKKRDRKEKDHDPLLLENTTLRKENERLTMPLRHAELIIDLQNKNSQMLGVPLTPTEDGGISCVSKSLTDSDSRLKMPRANQNHRGFDPDEASCLRLIEALADGNPLPDTSVICPDRQRLIALLAEISKGERSELFPSTRQVAECRGLSAQELASRAAFFLACLDTPGTDDPYTILGVDPTATSEEIKEAWLSRLSLYHPDRHPENSDWFTRQAARLNEAHHTLKDPVRRQAYDERRRRELLARQRSSPIAIQAVLSVPPLILPQSPRMARHRVTALITAASVAAVGLLLMALSRRLPAEPQLYLETVQPIPTASLPFPTPHSGPLLARPTRGTDPSLKASATPPMNRQPERRRMKHLHQASLPPGLPATHPDPSDYLTASERSAAGPILLAQALPPIVPEPKGLDRQEIDVLLDEYVDAYEKGDVDRLMATLSQKVREKGTLDYQAIRNGFVKGFTGRDQIIYRLKNLQVEIKGEQATVTAQYLILARNVAHSSKGTTVAGRIEWKIQREGDKLKIVTINY